MQEIGRRGEVVHVGCGDHDRVDQARLLVHAGMELHAEIPLIAFLDLVHLRIPLPFLVFGGTGRGDQSGIYDRALAHRHAPRTEVGFGGLKNLLPQPMLLQQVAEGEDRGLIMDPIADQLDAGKAPHGGHFDQGLLHRRVAQRIRLLHQMDA